MNVEADDVDGYDLSSIYCTRFCTFDNALNKLYDAFIDQTV